ncbi:hypothetical protein NQ176_g11402 [Zarea fungicola]|uniref:Uncharacterized protein n=1 Tax=Zarea fungicola TaxID=93591 RepID=A0ACC1MB97_9HYPO|nr:hypothetical protein NQ176_g11402 [Lecanicillium fungicola]
MRCETGLEDDEEGGSMSKSSSTALNEEAVIILQARQLCMEIEILRDPAGKETTWDEFNPRFGKIVSLGERLVSKLRRQETGRVFSFSSSMMDAFFLTGTYCRHFDVRHRALKLLKKHNAREGMCNSRLAYAIASAWAEIEEAPGEAKLRRAKNGINVIGSSGDEVEEDCECEARVFICNDHRVAVVAGEFHAGDVGTMTYWTHRDITRGQAGEFRSLVW